MSSRCDKNKFDDKYIRTDKDMWNLWYYFYAYFFCESRALVLDSNHIACLFLGLIRRFKREVNFDE